MREIKKTLSKFLIHSLSLLTFFCSQEIFFTETEKHKIQENLNTTDS